MKVLIRSRLLCGGLTLFVMLSPCFSKGAFKSFLALKGEVSIVIKNPHGDVIVDGYDADRSGYSLIGNLTGVGNESARISATEVSGGLITVEVEGGVSPTSLYVGIPFDYLKHLLVSAENGNVTIRNFNRQFAPKSFSPVPGRIVAFSSSGPPPQIVDTYAFKVIELVSNNASSLTGASCEALVAKSGQDAEYLSVFERTK